MRIDQLRPTPTAAEPLEIPAALLASVTRHQAHLAAMVGTLQAAGVDEAAVESGIHGLVDSYAAELTAAIRTMLKDRRRG